MELELKQEKDLRELFEVENGAFASGLFASVKRARSRRTGQLYAAKHSPKRKENYNEIKLLSRLSSPFIIAFKDAFETLAHVVVIMEFAPGGDLQSLIDADVVLHESHACKYIHQLLRGLEYMHSKSIAHLDIKPQNLLLMGNFPQTDSVIKICDFELSRVIHHGREEREIVGTPDYVAPEILQYDPLSLKADLWSTGIVVYVLLTGFSPFGGETDTETFNNIIHNDIDFPAELFDETVSRAGIEFINWLCQKQGSSRPSATSALQHVWLKSSRLSSRKKGISKSTYDLTRGREKFTERTRLRKSKSREQLWRSKIHLSLSSEKIERWASVASFPQTPHTRLNIDDKNNVRVQSAESLMTIILPATDPPTTRPSNSKLSNSLISNPAISNTNGKESFGLKRAENPPVHQPELTHGEKIKESVGDDEVQKSVAELISKFGGTHKSSKGGNNSQLNLDPIEEDEDQEVNETDENGEKAASPDGNEHQQHVVRKSIASNSSASSNGSGSRSSSTTTIDDIKATLAQLLPISVPTFVSMRSDILNGAEVAQLHEPLPTPEPEVRNLSKEPVSCTNSTRSTVTIPINSNVSGSGLGSTSKESSKMPKKPPNKYTSRYEMRIGEKSINGAGGNSVGASTKTTTRTTTPKTTICTGAVGRARNRLAK